MSDNFNINTTQAQANEAEGLDQNNPAMTYVDFGNQIVKNSQEQARQAQLVQQAIEQTKQQGLATTQGQEAQDLGVNPNLKEVLTVSQAVALLKAAGIDDAQIKAFKDAMGDNQTVSKVAVDTVIRKKELQSKLGTPFIASDADATNPSMFTKEGDQLVSGQSYYDTGDKDADGNAIYGHGGKEPKDTSLAVGEKDHQFWVRQFTQVVNKVNPYLSSNRTQVGVALASYVRCTRALETLSKMPVTKSDASNVIAEIGAVYKGGSPDAAQMLETQYHTIYGYFQNSIQGMFGKVRNYLPEDVRRQLVSRITDLENTSRQVIENSLQAAEAGYGEIISHNQDQWDKLVGFIDKALADPNAAKIVTEADGSQPYMPSATTDLRTDQAAHAGPDINALASALGLKKKVQ